MGWHKSEIKVVINSCWGGFGLSKKAEDRLVELGHPDSEYISGDFSGDDKERANPLLVQVVEELGDEANGECAKLRVVEVPRGVDWYIHDYDGQESVEESHRSWY